MSNRDSLGFGDLLPQDVVDIFAQEKHGKRGRKKRSHSLGRALGWLKGKTRKDLGAKGQSLGLGPALDLALDGHPAGHQGGHKGGQKSGRQAHPQAVPKRNDDDKTPAPPLIQENVFIEASRPEYLENLHTEALEGLKMMQQEETNNGVEFKDDESTISTMTVRTDGEGGGFVTDSTIADSSSVISVQSSVSTRSSRSGLTRQGSTFRPLNSGKKSEKTKTRRRHRKTVGGIPQHVQRELGLDRVDWSLTQRLDEEQLYNGETDDSLTPDGPQQAADSQKGAGAMNAVHPLSKDRLEQLAAAHAGHRDDMALLQRLGSDLSGGERPHSLAVPWMTTANSLQKPPSPVMSMSPQAAYMSKIIPNAVLPPSIDVVEISRGRSRSSVRTVSKSSLLVSSPAPSRASSRASSTRTTSSTITSASRHNPPNMSDSSCWSHSDSSETLVSDSSTISSSSTPRQKRSKDGDASAKEDKISVHSSVSKASKCTANGKLATKGDEVKKEGPFARSLSVMKSKKAPPPPSRSYSLHNKMKRRSRDLAEVGVNSGESSLQIVPASGEENVPSPIDSPGYNADTSSLEDSTGSVSFSPIRSQGLKAEETKKGYKDASKEKQKQEKKLSKVVSPSSGYSSQDGASVEVSKQLHSSSPRHKKGILAKLQKLFPGASPAASPPPPLQDVKPVDTVSVSPSVRALRELFNIPPPPKIHAPPPPPPEVWAHSKRSFELLLGPPAPDNLHAIIKKNPKDRRQQRQSPSASTEGSVKSLAAERKHKNPAATAEPVNGSALVPETKKVEESEILSAEKDRLAEQNVDLKGNSKVTENVEKVRVSDLINGMLLKAAEKREVRLAAVREEEVKTNMDTLPAILVARVPPSPSPPPVHLPPQPPSKQTTVVSPESSWPPPPPPMAQAGLNGPDESDFPLPPPPMFGEVGFVLPVQVPPEKSIPGGDSSTTTPAVMVVITEAEPQRPGSSQGVAPPPLDIPPPPPYTAPPPPVKSVSPLMLKKVSPPPPPKGVSPLPLPKVLSPPPPPKKVSPPPPSKEVSPLPLLKVVSPPPPQKEVSPPPPKETPPPSPPKEVSPPPKEAPPPSPPKEVSPPPKEAPSPSPPKEVSPPPQKEVSPPSPQKEVSPLPPKETPPPSPPKKVSPPPPKEVSPPPPKEVSPPSPPKEVSPPPPLKEVCPPPPPKDTPPPSPPKEVSPPFKETPPLSPPKEVSPPIPKEVCPPPPKEAPPPSPPKEVSPPPKEAPPPSPPQEVSPPPPKEVSPPPPEEVSLPPPKEVSPPSPKEVSPPPPEEISSPPPEEVSPPPPTEVSPPPPTEVSPPPPKEPSPPLVQEAVSVTLATVVPPSPVEEISPPLVIEVAPPPPKEVSTVSTEEVAPPSSQENTCQSSEEATPVSKLTPPTSIPPPPPPPPSQPESPEQEIALPQDSIPSESETNPVSSDSILSPPQSIPPPPPIELQPQVVPADTDGPATPEASPTPPSEVSIPPEKAPEPAPSPPANIPPSPPPSPVQGLASTEDQPSPASTECQTPELTSAPDVQEEPTPTTPEPPEAEVAMREKQPLPTSSASSEAPQKPVRRSLIIISPPPPSPPATVTAQPALPKSQSLTVPPASTPAVVSPTTKSPPATAVPHSMNLQEAIRLRTAARSKGGAASHLGLHSPTSPTGPHRSPTSTASFIFSKSNKKVVIETRKGPSEAEPVKKGVKVPPPVAKKPKTKGREIETSEGTEQTAGQEALQESVMDEKTNGTAGTVEGGGTPST